MKSKKLLAEFSKYCKANPELRFWQALRAWSGAGAILKAELTVEGQVKSFEDTYYKEEK